MTPAKSKVKIVCPSCGQKLDVSDLEPFDRVPCPACGEEVIAPKPFGTLVLEEPLCETGGLAVYRALDLTLDREVAVKVLLEEDEATGDAFIELARSSAAINHPGVVPIYSCGREEGKPFLVTQYMAGRGIDRSLTAAPQTQAEMRRVLEWARTVAGGLHAAHLQGLRHGAVVPGVILLDADDNAKIGDFGLADLLAGGEISAAPLAEKLSFFSPERLEGGPADLAGDIFSFGATLYRLLTGVEAVEFAPDPGEQVLAWRANTLVPARERVALIPREVSDMCDTMLCLDPAGRPASFQEIGDTLSAACKTRANKTRHAVSAPGRGIRIETPVARRLSEIRSAQAKAKRRPKATLLNFLLAAGLFILFLLLGGLCWRVLVRGGSASNETNEAWEAAPGAATKAGTVKARPASRSETRKENTVGGAVAPSPSPGDAKADDAATSLKLAAVLARHVANRPRPSDLDFGPLQDAFERYLSTLPIELRRGERLRYQFVASTKAYLVMVMKFLPFNDGEEAPIELRGGKRMTGTIPYCNEHEVAVRPTSDGTPRVFSWGDFAFEQQVRFLEYYASRRQEQETDSQLDSALHKLEAARDLLRLAVLCDWYGRYELSRRYAAEAVRCDASMGKTTRLLLPFLQVNPDEAKASTGDE